MLKEILLKIKDCIELIIGLIYLKELLKLSIKINDSWDILNQTCWKVEN